MGLSHLPYKQDKNKLLDDLGLKYEGLHLSY